MANALPAPAGRRIALIAHDHKKQDMLEWAEYNMSLLAGHELFATATTGRLLQERLGLPVTCFRSGPFGGDQQIGARIAEGQIDLLVFLWDPLEPQPHDPDVKALLRVAVAAVEPVEQDGIRLAQGPLQGGLGHAIVGLVGHQVRLPAAGWVVSWLEGRQGPASGPEGSGARDTRGSVTLEG